MSVTEDSEILEGKGLNSKQRLWFCKRNMIKQKLQECASGTGCTCESKNHRLEVFG